MKTKVHKLPGLICLIIYLILLTRFIVFKYPVSMMSEIINMWSLDLLIRNIQNANFIPFRTIGPSLFNPQLPVELPTLIYNIAAFIPLGFLLPCITPKARRWYVTFLIGLLIALIFEVVQLVTALGAADIDDLILNGTGVMIGYGLFKLAYAAYQRIHKTGKNPN